jgi:ribosomal protein S18 acetylase RimI-like enzyme
MAVTVDLRTATVDDLAFLLDVFAGTRPLEVEALGGRAAADAFLAWQWEAKRRGALATHRTVYEQIIVADGHDTGYIVWAVDEPDGVHVVDIAVRDGSRGVGVGTAALGELLVRADDHGATVSLDVEHLNPARRLYERIGFVEVARDERIARMERSPVS